MVAWAVIERCGGQVRAGIGGAYALDFAAILMLADAMGARSALLADLLPAIEPVMIKAYREGAEDAQ